VRPNPFRDSGTPEYSALTAAVRRLLDTVVDALALDAQTLTDAARALDATSATLETACAELPGDQQSGRLDGQRAPMPVWAYTQDDVDGFRASGQFSNGHTGPPGTVHGGWVAFAFDEVLAWSIVHAGYPGMTGRLTIRYRKPTPVGVPVEFRVEPPRVAGKVVNVHGTLTVGDTITAEADGLFVHFQGRSDAVPFDPGADVQFPRRPFPQASAAQEG
jgi:acyl-coenzyme A thioesterase PaaI-like protein